jgi:hypothetical protein
MGRTHREIATYVIEGVNPRGCGMQPEQEASMMLMDNWRDKVLEVIGQFPWYKDSLAVRLRTTVCRIFP